MKTETVKKVGLLAGLSAIVLFAAPTWATMKSCGSGATISVAQVEDVATCLSWGSVDVSAASGTSHNEAWGVATTVLYETGNMNLVTFNGANVGPALNNSEPFASPLQIANLNPAQIYLLFLYEIGSVRDWMAVSALGQSIIDGLDYTAALSTQTPRYEIRSLPAPVNVSEPGVLALLCLGWAGLAVARRRPAR